MSADPQAAVGLGWVKGNRSPGVVTSPGSQAGPEPWVCGLTASDRPTQCPEAWVLWGHFPRTAGGLGWDRSRGGLGGRGALPQGARPPGGSWVFSRSGAHCWLGAGKGRARPGSQHASWFSSLAGIHGGPVSATTCREASRWPCRPSHPSAARREEGAGTHAGQLLAVGRGLCADLAETLSFRCDM